MSGRVIEFDAEVPVNVSLSATDAGGNTYDVYPPSVCIVARPSSLLAIAYATERQRGRFKVIPFTAAGEVTWPRPCRWPPRTRPTRTRRTIPLFSRRRSWPALIGGSASYRSASAGGVLN